MVEAREQVEQAEWHCEEELRKQRQAFETINGGEQLSTWIELDNYSRLGHFAPALGGARLPLVHEYSLSIRLSPLGDFLFR